MASAISAEVTATKRSPDPRRPDLDQIEIRIRKFLIDEIMFGEQISLDSEESLLDRGVIDSTGIVEIVSFLQDSFGITIEDDELTRANLDAISRMTALVARKMALR